MKAALVDRRLGAGEEARWATGRERGPEAVVAELVERVGEFVAAGRSRYGEVGAVGVGVPGIVDEGAGVAVASANLGWRDVPLRELLAKRCGAPVALGHDVRVGALAEGVAGAARGARHYLYVMLGTGVGAALVLGGETYAGARGGGGELGHTTVDPAGPPCGCGRRGCLEAFASASAVARRYQERTGAEADARAVAARAATGDTDAAAVWGEAVGALGFALANATMLLEPERVVIGGGMAAAGEWLFEPLHGAVEAGVSYLAPPPLFAARFGDDAAWRGAACAAWLALGVPRAELEAAW